MNNLFKRLWRHKGQSILTMLILFVLATLLFMSQMMSKANAQLSAMIEEDTGLYFYITGNININNVQSDKTVHNEAYKNYLDLFAEIGDHEGIIYADYARLLGGVFVTCGDMADSEDFECLYFPVIPENYFNLPKTCEAFTSNCQEYIRFGTMPLNETANEERYVKLFSESGGLTHNLRPDIIGVNQTSFGDLENGLIDIVAGITFSNDDLQDGAFKVIVPQFAYYVRDDGVKDQLEIGDTVTLTIDGSADQSFSFEIIGLHNGINGIDSPYSLINDPIYNNIYIPAKAFESIRDAYVKEYQSKDMPLSASPEALTPMLFRVGYRSIMQELLEELTPRLQDLSKIENGIPYSYLSSLDTYADAITMTESNSFIFSVLYYILIVLTFGTLIMINLFNINARRKEIGILNAIGAAKTKINLLLFGEFVLLSILPVGLAIGVSSVFAKMYAENEFSYQIMKILSGEYNPNFYDNTGTGTLVLKFHINFGLTDYLILILFWVLITLTAFGFSYLKLRRLDPKTILLMGEKE